MELNKIYNIDCAIGMDRMKEDGILVDCVLTSPPYNTMRNGQDDVGYDYYQDSIDNDSYINWIVELFKKFNSILSKDGKIIWNMSYGAENTECMNLTIASILKNTNFTLADILLWEKKTATPNNVSKNKLTRIFEFVYVFCRRSEFNTFNTNKKVISKMPSGQDVYENIYNKIVADNNDGSCPFNKATFSTDFVGRLLDIYCKRDEIVLDPFMGTGTTAVACKIRGNKFIGFELSENQCEWANKRINSSAFITNLF